MLFAIDPGPAQSGYVVLDDRAGVLDAGTLDNADVLSLVAAGKSRTTLAIEWITSYGMPVGAEVFETALWIGRYVQAWHHPEGVLLIPRAEIKVRLCGSSRARDPNIRQALIDLYQANGDPAIGTAKRPGPLHKVHSHAWSALAVAIVAIAKSARKSGDPLPELFKHADLERIA